MTRCYVCTKRLRTAVPRKSSTIEPPHKTTARGLVSKPSNPAKLSHAVHCQNASQRKPEKVSLLSLPHILMKNVLNLLPYVLESESVKSILRTPPRCTTLQSKNTIHIEEKKNTFKLSWVIFLPPIQFSTNQASQPVTGDGASTSWHQTQLLLELGGGPPVQEHTRFTDCCQLYSAKTKLHHLS